MSVAAVVFGVACVLAAAGVMYMQATFPKGDTAAFFAFGVVAFAALLAMLWAWDRRRTDGECPECGRPFSRESEYRKHYRDAHGS